jgi:putative membrane protein
MKAPLFLALTGALALAACNNNSDQAPAATDTAAATPAATDSATATVDTTSPQGFVSAAASSDMYEIAAAKLAQQQGKSDKVKSFASMMVKDHTGSSSKLKAAADKAGGLTVPTEMQDKHQKMLDGLKASGDNFDTVYAQQQVAAHSEALSLMKTQSESGSSDPLKKFATDVTPVIQHHADEAAKLP